MRRIDFRYWYAIILFVITYVILMQYSELLFALQDNSIFISGKTFMLDCLSRRHGIWIWVGCYLTQFCYYPWLGALILCGIWTATFMLLAFGFRLNRLWSLAASFPVIYQLYAFICLGYWLYYCKAPGYVFAQATGILAVALITSVVTATGRLVLKGKNRNPYLAGASIIVAFVFYFTAKPLVKSYSWKPAPKNFYSELRMYKAIDEYRWEDVINGVKEAQNPTRLMVMYKNIALLHSGKITDMFTTNNCPGNIETPEGLNVHMTHMCGPMLYYQFGQMNYAYRWAIENNLKYGTSVRNMKILIKSAIFNQEFDVAEKYISIMKATVFHKHWAFEQEQSLANSTVFMQTQDYADLAPLLNEDQNALDTDDGLCERWMLYHFADLLKPTSSKLEDLIMCMSLWNKDELAFCIHFYDYVNRHGNDNIPDLYQEGAILLCNQKKSPIQLNDFPFSPMISNRYNSFVQDYINLQQNGVDHKQIGERMKPVYGRTFWWYYHFYTDFKFY